MCWSIQVIKLQKENYYRMIGHIPELYDPAHAPGNNGIYPNSYLNNSTYNGTAITANYIPSIQGYQCHVPLNFWFCRNSGLALPLIALQYHEVKVMVTFASSVPGLSGIGQTQLWADYIYLDTDERRRFAQVSHEYLIEQVQHTSGSDASLDLGAYAIISTTNVERLRISDRDILAADDYVPQFSQSLATVQYVLDNAGDSYDDTAIKSDLASEASTRAAADTELQFSVGALS